MPSGGPVSCEHCQGLAGAVQAAVEAHVEALRRDQAVDTGMEAMAAIALNLAAKLDAGPEEGAKGDPTSGWARELRATLIELGRGGEDDGDDDSWLGRLPGPGASEVRDAEN